MANIIDCPQVMARDMLMPIEDPAWGMVRMVGQPIKSSGAPPPPTEPPPDLGQHSRAILRELGGIDDATYAALHERGIV